MYTPILLTKEIFNNMMSGWSDFLHVFDEPLKTGDAEEKARYRTAGNHLVGVLEEIKTQLNVRKEQVRLYELHTMASLPRSPAKLAPYRCSYILHQEKGGTAPARLYYVKPEEDIKKPPVLEPVKITDYAQFKLQIDAIKSGLASPLSSTGEQVFEQVFGEIKDHSASVMKLTEEEIRQLITENGGHNPIRLHALVTSDFDMLAAEVAHIMGRCRSIEPYRAKYLSSDLTKPTVPGPLTPCHIYYDATLRQLVTDAAIILENCDLINLYILASKKALFGEAAFHRIRQQGLSYLQIVLICAASIGLAVATGGVLAPIIIPAVGGLLAGVIVTGAVTAGIGGLGGSLLTSAFLNERLEEAAKRALLTTGKAMLFGTLGGLAGGAVAAAVVPAVSVLGERGVSTLVGAAGGGVAGVARGVYEARHAGHSGWQAVKTIGIHGGIGLGVGAFIGAVGSAGFDSKSSLHTDAVPAPNLVPLPPSHGMLHAPLSPSLGHGAGFHGGHDVVMLDVDASSAVSALSSVTETDERKRAKESTQIEDKIVTFIRENKPTPEEEVRIFEDYKKAEEVLNATLVAPPLPKTTYKDALALFDAEEVSQPSLVARTVFGVEGSAQLVSVVKPNKSRCLVM